MNYDVIIIGGGPAGMSALVWCRSLDLNAFLFEKTPELGGQMLQMFHRVSDYPGLIAGNGHELRDHFTAQLVELGLSYRTGCRITGIDLRERRLRCEDRPASGQALIIATGVSKRRLGIPGEDQFETRGVTFFGTRDHSRYAGKRVCVVGGGDSAVQNSLVLSRICPHVTLIHRSERFRARHVWMKEARETSNISIMPHTTVKAIEGGEGGEAVERLIVGDAESGEQKTIETEGVFIKIGVKPNTEAFEGQVELDDDGYIKVDRRQRTSVDRVYAVGDVRRPPCLSVATAVGDGANAAKDVADVLSEKGLC